MRSLLLNGKIVAGCCLLFFLVACNQPEIGAETQLSKAEQDSFVYSLIRYIGKLPGKVNHSNKFSSEFDDYYKELSKKHQLRYYYKDKGGKEYYSITRIAPSIIEKYVSVNGMLLRDKAGKIIQFEEIFRTWKMPLNEQLEVTEKLFREMLAGKDLSKYYPENSGKAYIIEFPNAEVYYDKVKQQWVSKREDVLEPYYKLKEQTLRDEAKSEVVN